MMCVKEAVSERLARMLVLVLVVVVLLGNQKNGGIVVGNTMFAKETPTELNIDLPVMATAFVQTGNELHYFSDVEYHENLIGGSPVKSSVESEPLLNNQLQFSPKELNFGDQSMGVPHQEKVRVHNPTASTVRFDAISGSTVHFHCSFPEHKTVNPGEATSFDVVFLPRQEGPIDNVLFVHSSLGTFTYNVHGRGASNPYRIRPFVGARVPLNGTFVSTVQLHNPHASTLRITEMYTSGGDLHLELPYVAPDTTYSSSLWEIAPYQTKTIMSAKMLAAKERNANAYIKIKTDLKTTPSRAKGGGAVAAGSVEEDESMIVEHSEETLIVPLEVEVTRKRGIFATVDLLDFGLIRWGEKSQQLTLEIVSTLEKGIDIESLYVERGDEPNGIYMEFASKPPISIKCGARQQPGAPKAIAKVQFDSKLLKSQIAAVADADGAKLMRYKGRIIADSRGGNYNISVPYVATVYTGSLVQSADETAFHSQQEPPVSHGVSLTNNLPFGLAIWNISLAANARKSFIAKLLGRVVTLEAGESKPVFWLKYAAKESDNFASHCTLYTNVTTFNIPIVIFNGKLRVSLYSIDQSQFDFGLMDAGDSRSIQFAIVNENPVAVKVKQLRNALPMMTSLTLLGIESGNQTILANTNQQQQQQKQQQQKQGDWNHAWQQGMDLQLPGGSFAVFRYTLTAPLDRSVLRDAFVIETDFERMTFPVKYALDEGAVVSVPEKLSFQRAFPGKMSSQALQMYSTFKKDMHILRMSTLSHDPRIFFESFPADSPPLLRAGHLSNLGRVLFMPGATCTDDCYVGMPLHTADGQWFTYGIKLPQNLAEIDSYLYKRLRRKWLAIKSSGRNMVNATVVVDTEEVKHLTVPVQGELIWPRLLTKSVVRFPLTAVGNFTIVNLTLTNPSSLPVVVQLLPLVIYPDAEALVDFFRDELDAPLTEPVEMNETLMFSLRDTELFTLKRDSPVPKLREQLEAILGIQIPKFTLSMLLQPGMKVRIRVGFLPSDYTLRSSLLLIRNNLTVMEPVVLYGRGAHMDMQVEGRSARTKDPLMFEIQPHHLSDCHNPKRLTHKLFTTLTVKRSFTVMNSGEVAFRVVNMSLNNIPCENRGFKILNCHPFTLEPNQTHIIDIAYTPDFLMSWNEAALQFYMHMNGTSWLFPLGASVPRHLLSKCHAALPRPPFESLMYYSCVSALIFCLVCVVACAYLEGDRTVTCAIRQQYSQTRRVFDLNAINPNAISAGRQTPAAGTVAGAAGASSTTSGDGKHSPRRHVLHYAEDANIFVRSFWQTANGVLWLFSFVWQFRSDEPSTSTKPSRNRTAKAPVVKSIQVQTSSKLDYSNNMKNSANKNLKSASASDSSSSQVVPLQSNTQTSSRSSNMKQSNGAATRSVKNKGPSSIASNSSQSQTKSPDPSPSIATASKTFGMVTRPDDLNKPTNTTLNKEHVRNWIECGGEMKKGRSVHSGGRRRSESLSDAALIGTIPTTPHGHINYILRSEALMDGDRSRKYRGGGGVHKGGISRSGDELSARGGIATAATATAKTTKSTKAPAPDGTHLPSSCSHPMSRRKLCKSGSLQRSSDAGGGLATTNEHTSSMSSDVDSDLMSIGGVGGGDTSTTQQQQQQHMMRNATNRSPSLSVSGAPMNANERTRNWLLPPPPSSSSGERALDERSEAGLSDASAAPEWADAPPMNSSDGNVDDDFNALAIAAARLFDSNDAASLPLPSSNVLPQSSSTSNNKQTTPNKQSRRNTRKKHGGNNNSNNTNKNNNSSNNNNNNNKLSAASSRSASCSSLDTNGAIRESNRQAVSQQQQHHHHQQHQQHHQQHHQQQQPQQQSHTKSRRRTQQKLTTNTSSNAKQQQQLQLQQQPQQQQHIDRPDGHRPSAFIQQLQMERRIAEEKYMKKKKINKLNEDSHEPWPFFDLKLPALAENLWDTEFETNDSCAAAAAATSGVVGGGGGGGVQHQPPAAPPPIWRPPHVRSTNWPPTPTDETPIRNDVVAQSVLAFRFNPQAEPFVVASANNNGISGGNSSSSSGSNSNSRQPSIVTPDTPMAPIGRPAPTQTSGLFDGLMDDPLGLSGSLFGRGATNIWASTTPSSTTTTTITPSNRITLSEGNDTNPAAVYWAEKFLADQEDDK